MFVPWIAAHRVDVPERKRGFRNPLGLKSRQIRSNILESAWE